MVVHLLQKIPRLRVRKVILMSNEIKSVGLSRILFPDAKKFNQCYMLARELGSGAFSVVKLGVNLVSHIFFV